MKRNKKKLLILIFSFVLIITAATLITSAVLSSGVTLGREEESTLGPEDILTGSADFLLFCADSRKNLTYAAILNISLDEALFSVSSLDPEKLCFADGKRLTLSEHYIDGGAGRLVSAAENCTGVQASRYVGVTEHNFVRIIKMLGAVRVYVENDISYSYNDISLQLQKGMNDLSYKNLLDYIKFGSRGKELLRLQAEAFCSIFEAYFTPENLSGGEAFFTKLINLLDTDINAYDYMASLPVMEALMESGVEFVSKGEY